MDVGDRNEREKGDKMKAGVYGKAAIAFRDYNGQRLKVSHVEPSHACATPVLLPCYLHHQAPIPAPK